VNVLAVDEHRWWTPRERAEASKNELVTADGRIRHVEDLETGRREAGRLCLVGNDQQVAHQVE
jgi:hypothetical protein